MNIKIFCLISLLSGPSVWANGLVPISGGDVSSQAWECVAQGLPKSGGTVWQSVLAQGESENDATVAATQACFDLALDYCNVISCRQL